MAFTITDRVYTTTTDSDDLFGAFTSGSDGPPPCIYLERIVIRNTTAGAGTFFLQQKNAAGSWVTVEQFDMAAVNDKAVVEDNIESRHGIRVDFDGADTAAVTYYTR